MLTTMELAHVTGGGRGGLATGGFWTGRTRDDEDRAATCGRGLGTGGFWTGRTRCEEDDPNWLRGGDDRDGGSSSSSSSTDPR